MCPNQKNIALIFIVKIEWNLSISQSNIVAKSGKFPTTMALQNLHFFIPYIKEQGIRDVHEIVRVRTITAKEARQTEDEDTPVDDLRLAFELRFSRRLFPDYQKIDTRNLANYTFIGTTFDQLNKLPIAD